MTNVWFYVYGFLSLISLSVIIWAIVDILRRPAWMMTPGRKAFWVIMLGVLWFFGLWPIALVWAIVYLLVLRRRFSTSTPMPTIGPHPLDPPKLPVGPQLPPGWFPDPSGQFHERWWDGRGWSDRVRSADS